MMICLCLEYQSLDVVALKNYSNRVVYPFGDSLSDVGNNIATFPGQFANAKLSPNGVQFPMHPVDCFCVSKVLVDFLAFGMRRRPLYPILRGISSDFTHGVSFAASARLSIGWIQRISHSILSECAT